MAREFGKLVPYLWYKECLLRLRKLAWQVAVTRGFRLFNKNIGSRKTVRLCTAIESCPVVVPET